MIPQSIIDEAMAEDPASASVESLAEFRDDIAAKTERAELKRRGILGPDFKKEDEELRLAEEQQGLEPEEPMDPVTGNIIAFDQASRAKFTRQPYLHCTNAAA